MPYHDYINPPADLVVRIQNPKYAFIVILPVSPKSYAYFPFVSEGQAEGSIALNSMSLLSLKDFPNGEQ